MEADVTSGIMESEDELPGTCYFAVVYQAEGHRLVLIFPDHLDIHKTTHPYLLSAKQKYLSSFSQAVLLIILRWTDTTHYLGYVSVCTVIRSYLYLRRLSHRAITHPLSLALGVTIDPGRPCAVYFSQLNPGLVRLTNPLADVWKSETTPNHKKKPTSSKSALGFAVRSAAMGNVVSYAEEAVVVAEVPPVQIAFAILICAIFDFRRTSVLAWRAPPPPSPLPRVAGTRG